MPSCRYVSYVRIWVLCIDVRSIEEAQMDQCWSSHKIHARGIELPECADRPWSNWKATDARMTMFDLY